jgi:hypothetical protein
MTPATDHSARAVREPDTRPEPLAATLPLATAPAPAAPPALGRRLAARLFLWTAAVVAATVGAGVAVTAHHGRAATRRAGRDAIARARSAWRTFTAEHEVSRMVVVRGLAEQALAQGLLPATAAPEAIRAWLGGQGESAGAAFLALLDGQGSFVARSDRPVEEVRGRSVAHAAFVKRALSGEEAVGLVREGQRLYMVAAAPLSRRGAGSAGEGGVLFAAYPLDRASAEAIAVLSGSDVTFLALVGGEGEPPRAEASASTLAAPEAMLQALSREASVLDRVLGRSEDAGPVWLAANGGEVLAAALPLRTGGGEVIGALVTSRSTSELAEPFAQAGRSLVLVGLAALLVSAPVSWALARRLARLAAPRG